MTETGLVRGVCQTAKSSGLVTVVVGSQTVPANCPQDLTVAAGDPVLIAKLGSAWYVVQRYFSAVGTQMPAGGEPPSAPPTTTGATTFVPRQTASYRNGKWRTDTDQVIQGEFGGQGNHHGVAFYGTQLTTLSGVTVLSATLKARRAEGGSFAAQKTDLYGVTQSSKPGGAPTFASSSTSGPDLAVGATKTDIAVSTTLIGSMIAGTYGGLGIFRSGGTPYVRLAGLSDYSGAFALTVKWRRAG